MLFYYFADMKGYRFRFSRFSMSGRSSADESHFVEQMAGSCELVDYEHHIADVQGDVSADLGVEDYVAHGALPHSVEVDADEVSVSIYHRAS